MSAPSTANFKHLVYAAMVTLPVGVVLFIGAIVAIVAKLVALGGVLMALAVASVGIGCVLMLRVRNRARAVAHDMQAKRQSDLDTAFRDYPGGGRLP
ncbi:MAG: hypothetical protein ACRDOI_39710 [Trebonia sp.]